MSSTNYVTLSSAFATFAYAGLILGALRHRAYITAAAATVAGLGALLAAMGNLAGISYVRPLFLVLFTFMAIEKIRLRVRTRQLESELAVLRAIFQREALTVKSSIDPDPRTQGETHALDDQS